MTDIAFRPYCRTDREACISIFDANCPEFFAPNERPEYGRFLDTLSEGYEVCEVDGNVQGAFGLPATGRNVKTLCWIMLDPRTQGIGIGSKIMERAIHLARASQTDVVKIAASHKSAPFFAKFGARPVKFTKDGWGPGMDRVDMELPL